MTKNQAIRQINEAIGFNRLNTENTHWSNIVEYGAEEGWWLNIPFHKFAQDLNFILNNEKESIFIHIKIPANSIENAHRVFRNKSDTADIFMPHTGANRLIDCQSGSSRLDFNNCSSQEYKHNPGIAN